MRIDASGNVGIGTTAPAVKFQVEQNQAAYTYSDLVNTTNGGGAIYRLVIRNIANTATTTVDFAKLIGSGLAINNNDTNAANFTSFGVGASERLRIDSSGNILKQYGTAFQSLTSGGSTSHMLSYQTWNGTANLLVLGNTFDGIVFGTGGGTMTEKARINSGGYFKTANDGNYNDAGGNYCEFLNTNNNQILRLAASNASYTSSGIELLISRNTTNNTFYAFSYYNVGAAAFKFRVADSGNVTNTNNSYGAISDIKLKENVVDATSKLEKLNQVRVVNYNFIGSEQKQLGVIAQELEQIFPGMVEESPDRDAEGNDLGTTTKSVKYSVFVPMLIKAMQEQQQMIETLQAKVAALEGKK
jgi:hypothetical protein